MLVQKLTTGSITKVRLGSFPSRTNNFIVGLALLRRRRRNLPLRRRGLFKLAQQRLIALLQLVDAVEKLALGGLGLFVRLLPEGDAVEVLVRGGGEMGISTVLDVLTDLENVIW